jgi:hypothetical protein
MLRNCGKLFLPNKKTTKSEQNIYTTPGLKTWIKEVDQHMPHLSQAQIVLLALWSFGMVLARSCGQSSVTQMIASLTGENPDNVRQRLREWCWDQKDKAGKKRTEVEVTSCFAPLLRWILQDWEATEKSIALAMDATTLGERYVVLAISVVYRSCAIPIAWKVFAVDQQKGWKAEWQRLFALFAGVIPADWTVLVLADRGLYADWLFRAITDLHWHPFLRINANGKYRAEGSSQFMPLSSLAGTIGCQWSGVVTCFKTHPLQATLLVNWAEGYTDPWLILTDLQPHQAKIAWYRLRAWIECGFKHTKRAGWQWQNTRMTDPHRAERHWLVMAVATLWVVRVGGVVDANLPSSSLLGSLPAPVIHTSQRSRPRLLSCFHLGLFEILSALINRTSIPLGSFHVDQDYFN